MVKLKNHFACVVKSDSFSNSFLEVANVDRSSQTGKSLEQQ
jgi:hypothetical protein